MTSKRFKNLSQMITVFAIIVYIDSPDKKSLVLGKAHRKKGKKNKK